MFVVLGSTAKGLGASGITIDQEIERLNAMIAEAKQAQDPDRRDPARGQGAARQAGRRRRALHRRDCAVRQYLVVKKDGNEDGRFDAIAKKTGAPLTLIDDAMDFGDVVKAMYAK